MQQVSAEASNSIGKDYVVFCICCLQPFFHCYGSIQNIHVWRGFEAPEPVVSSAVQV
jgi:hypothetical protein